jgi:hypothetical protein
VVVHGVVREDDAFARTRDGGDRAAHVATRIERGLGDAAHHEFRFAEALQERLRRGRRATAADLRDPSGEAVQIRRDLLRGHGVQLQSPCGRSDHVATGVAAAGRHGADLREGAHALKKLEREWCGVREVERGVVGHRARDCAYDASERKSRGAFAQFRTEHAWARLDMRGQRGNDPTVRSQHRCSSSVVASVVVLLASTSCARTRGGTDSMVAGGRAGAPEIVSDLNGWGPLRLGMRWNDAQSALRSASIGFHTLVRHSAPPDGISAMLLMLELPPSEGATRRQGEIEFGTDSAADADPPTGGIVRIQIDWLGADRANADAHFAALLRQLGPPDRQAAPPGNAVETVSAWRRSTASLVLFRRGLGPMSAYSEVYQPRSGL